MISRDMQVYNYYTLGDSSGYGQPTISQEAQGTIKISINTISTAIEDSAKYKSAQYIGLTKEPVTDKYVIAFGNEKLKVLYVNPKGRYKQVFMVAV